MKSLIGGTGLAVSVTALMLAVTGSSDGDGMLPFTDLELASIALVGLAVLLSGLSLRGYSARRSNQAANVRRALENCCPGDYA